MVDVRHSRSSEKWEAAPMQKRDCRVVVACMLTSVLTEGISANRIRRWVASERFSRRRHRPTDRFQSTRYCITSPDARAVSWLLPLPQKSPVLPLSLARSLRWGLRSVLILITVSPRVPRLFVVATSTPEFGKFSPFQVYVVWLAKIMM